MRKILLSSLLLLLALMGLSRCAKLEVDRSAAANFDCLWQLIDRKYCYLESKNIPWQSLGDSYRARALATTSERELFDVMAELLDHLRDGHVNLRSSFDRSVCTSWYDAYPADINIDILYSDRYLGDYKRAGGLLYQRISGDSIGYIRYSSFGQSLSTSNLLHVFDYFKGCCGLIIDIRENGGGNLNYSNLLASCFFKEKTLTGYMRHKSGPGHGDFSQAQAVFSDPSLTTAKWVDKPVVVLTNRMCYSATNDFICKMRYAPKVCIMGAKSGGGGGMPLDNELPNGWHLNFSACAMFTAEMEDIEGGILPDIEVHLRPEDEKKGLCTLVEGAVDYIKNVRSSGIK